MASEVHIVGGKVVKTKDDSVHLVGNKIVKGLVSGGGPPSGIIFCGSTIAKFCGSTISKLNGV